MCFDQFRGKGFTKMNQVDTIQKNDILAVLEALFNTCEDAVLLANESLEIIFANDKAIETLNGNLELFITPQNQQGWGIYDVNHQPLSQVQELPLVRVLGGETIHDLIVLLESPQIRPGRWLSVSGHPIAGSVNWGRGGLLIVRDITRRKLQDEQDFRLNCRDELTGLLTRSLFLEEVQISFNEAKKNISSCFSLLFIDVDRFKIINDSFGHIVGDLLLIEISKRIKQSLRQGDSVARLGGDEFAVILRNITNRDQVIEIVDRLVDSIANAYYIESHEIFADLSVGISVYNSDYSTAEELVRDADIAMYRSKSEPEVYYRFFEPKMKVVENDNLKLEVELRHALAEQEFLLHYQPIVSIQNQDTNGFEALVRWQHPQKGMLLPASFIPIAESSGLIVPLGWWVLHEACRQMRAWNTRFPGSESWFVSVNMSSKQFSQKCAVKKIRDILEETKLPGRNLKLELTESILIAHSDTIISQLEEIRSLGIKLAIDDFGTGYSSLSYLHRFPFDSLKIDRSFIEDADLDYEKLEILESVVRLAWNLGLEVVAEGIETARSYAQLKSLNCEFGQGYLFSRPVDAKTIEARLSQR
jgi:diguanylate cyclase (GGDEF)-like protein